MTPPEPSLLHLTEKCKPSQGLLHFSSYPSNYGTSTGFRVSLWFRVHKGYYLSAGTGTPFPSPSPPSDSGAESIEGQSLQASCRRVFGSGRILPPRPVLILPRVWTWQQYSTVQDPSSPYSRRPRHVSFICLHLLIWNGAMAFLPSPSYLKWYNGFSVGS